MKTPNFRVKDSNAGAQEYQPFPGATRETPKYCTLKRFTPSATPFTPFR
ncbi:hypothetical protein [Mucilaginibacter ginsenosidivorans]|nr:hypothetical protein [Mucilaginibacter ginsenosidivorans]